MVVPAEAGRGGEADAAERHVSRPSFTHGPFLNTRRGRGEMWFRVCSWCDGSSD